MCERLDWLMRRTVLAQADGVMCGDVDNTLVGERREADRTCGIGDEVQESAAGWDGSALYSETVHDTSHAVFTHAVAKVAAGPVADAERRRLEVDCVLPAGVVGARQVCRSGKQIRKAAPAQLRGSP